MKVHHNEQRLPFATVCMIASLCTGCVTDNQGATAPFGDPTTALIGFVIGFARQVVAAFLF